jgi:hypothetical protein
VETKLELGDCSGRIRDERDPALCELLNRDVSNLCGWSNFRNKSCVTCACLLRFTFRILLKFILVLKFDLTLSVISSV